MMPTYRFWLMQKNCLQGGEIEDFPGEIDYFNNDSTDIKNGKFNFQLPALHTLQLEVCT